MTRHRARVRVALASATTLAMGLLWGAGGTTVTAQGTPPGAAASGACAGLVELLPQQLNGTALQSQAFVGTDEAFSALLPIVDPLLQTLGLAAADLCVVWFQYEELDGFLPYMMRRFRGADPKALLEPGIQVLTPLVCDPSYLTCTRSEATVAGRPVTRIEGTAEATHDVTDFYGFGDIIVLGTESATFEAVISALSAPDATLPDVTPSPTPTPSPSPTPTPSPSPTPTPSPSPSPTATPAASGFWSLVAGSPQAQNTTYSTDPTYTDTFGGRAGSATITVSVQSAAGLPHVHSDSFQWTQPPATLRPATTSTCPSPSRTRPGSGRQMMR